MIRFGRNRKHGDVDLPPRSNIDAFVGVYEEMFEPVYRYCRIRISDPRDAEDLAAAIFAKALAAYPPAKQESTRSWLFSIAHNMVANHYRGRAQRNRIEPLDEQMDFIDPGGLPDQIVVEAEERRSLHAALSTLTNDQRRVVDLRLAGLTGPEIAEITGRSHAAVKMLQLRAIERLRQILDPSIQIMTEEDDHARR